MAHLHAHALFDGQTWAEGRHLHWGEDGRLLAVDGAASPRTGSPATWVVPGVPNLHSHAFQRAMAGLAERQESEADTFWTWRDWMYRFAATLSPDDVHVIARQLYIEMLEAGFTSVCEFHYLHHDVDGRPYATPSAMADAIVAAAHDAGIRLTLLPVLYQRGGFDGRPLSTRQQRFGHATDAYLRLLDALQRHTSSKVRVGVAFHSLRAVDLPAMRVVLEAFPDPTTPVHLHIAEQQPEVVDCLATHGRRPVQFLLDEMPVDARWTLVHATHLDEAEVHGIARSGAVVAICPTTEGNLGDGLFPLRAFLAAGGRYGVGSDSHVSVSPVEELRWLEYGQRLVEQKRNRALLGPGSTSEAMMKAVAASAASATGHATGVLLSGEQADVLVLDDAAPALAAATRHDLLDRFVFCGNGALVRDVFVGGRCVVSDGRHAQREASRSAYAATLRRLLNA